MRRCGAKAAKKGSWWEVFRRKEAAWEEVARARCVGGQVVRRVFRSRAVPGRGWVVGKKVACRADCLAANSARGTGSWAQAWKISLDCGCGGGMGQFYYEEDGRGLRG